MLDFRSKPGNNPNYGQQTQPPAPTGMQSSPPFQADQFNPMNNSNDQPQQQQQQLHNYKPQFNNNNNNNNNLMLMLSGLMGQSNHRKSTK